MCDLAVLRRLQQGNLCEVVSQTWKPQQLAGQCIGVNMKVLDCAREVLGDDVEIVIGGVEIGNQQVFGFEPMSTRLHENDDRPRVDLHCWLRCPSDGFLLDLTLASTLRDKRGYDSSFIPEGTVYIDSCLADELGIKHIEAISGDDAIAFIITNFRC